MLAIRNLAIILLLALASPAVAQVSYLGNGGGTSGLGGSCCTWVAVVPVVGSATCPSDQAAAHPGCQVISQAQYTAFLVAQQNANLPGRASAALAGGITLTCTATNTNNFSGTYIITDEFNSRLLSLQAGMSGAYTAAFIQTIGIPDSGGVLHYPKSTAAFSTIYVILNGYWLQLLQWRDTGGATAIPPPTSSAC